MSAPDESPVDVHLAILERLGAVEPAPAPRTRSRLVAVASRSAALAAAATVVALALLATSRQSERGIVRRQPERVVASPYPALTATALDASVDEETRLALVDQLAGDHRDEATDVLLAGAGGSSLVVSMASLRALRGRPCERVGRSLADWLGHAEWQRRAWAAKVLGENGCTGAVVPLRARLARERDTRVRRELSAALATLGGRTTG